MSHEIKIFAEWEGVGLEVAPSLLMGLDLDSSGWENIPGGAALRLVEQTRGDQHGGLWDGSIELIVSFATGVASGIVANWIFDKIRKGKPSSPCLKVKKHLALKMF
jgi:hypothetical protein